MKTALQCVEGFYTCNLFTIPRSEGVNGQYMGTTAIYSVSTKSSSFQALA